VYIILLVHDEDLHLYKAVLLGQASETLRATTGWACGNPMHIIREISWDSSACEDQQAGGIILRSILGRQIEDGRWTELDQNYLQFQILGLTVFNLTVLLV
jgi:hypothetical protein